MTPRPLALVTGASRGIGAALARCFARAGYDLVLTARDEDALARAAAPLSEVGASAHVFAIDLADPAAPARLLADLAARDLRPQALVNNAGLGVMGPVADADLARQLQTIDVNVRALTELTVRLLPGMLERGRGGVLNVASVAAFQPGPNMAVYYASKAFVLSFTEALAQELEGTGVTATALCPGLTPTDFQARSGLDASAAVRLAPGMSAEAVAAAGYEGFARGRRVVVPGAANKAVAATSGLAPRRLTLPLIARLQRRSS